MNVKRSPVRAAVRLSLFVLLNLVLIPLYAAGLLFWPRICRPVQVQWSICCYRLAGIRPHVIGKASAQGATLFVVNHVSYLDIPVLAAVIDATFVAKSEVANWPLFGIIAKLTRTIFVQRSPSQATTQRQKLLERLDRGESLLLFPEGTSTDGSGVAPFKSALFSIAEPSHTGTPTIVQPVSIAYTRLIDGTPLTGALRNLYCWFGDATLLPHLMRVMSLPGAEAEVRFLAPIVISEPVDRKDIAHQCETAVAAGVAAAHGQPASTTLPTDAAAQ